MTGYLYFMSVLKKLHRGLFAKAFFSALLLCILILPISSAYSADIDTDSPTIVCKFKYDSSNNRIPGSGPGYEPLPNGSPNQLYKVKTGFTYKVVECVEDIILRKVTNNEFQNIRDDIKSTIVYLFAIYIAFFGYQVSLGGVQKPMAESMVHLFKVTAVAFFSIATGVDIIYPMFVDAQQVLVEVVTSKALISSTECTNNSTYTVVWERVDCLFASVLAADLPAGGQGSINMATEAWYNNHRTPFTLPGTILGLALGPIGVVVVVIAVATIFIILIAFASAVVYYVMCLVAVIVLAIIAPIIIPAILFSATKGIFDTWLRALMAYTVQPAILFAYLAFMTHAMNLVVYGTNVQNSQFGLYKTLQLAHTQLTDPNTKKYKNSLRAFTENLAGAGYDPSDVDTKLGDQTRSSLLTVPTIELQPDDQAALLINLLAVMMIAALLNSFMFNVMAFGAQLAGIPYTFSMGNFTNLFSTAMFLGRGKK